MPDFTLETLLTTPSVTVKDAVCTGASNHPGDSACAAHAHLAFPYRGAYVRHVERDETVAESNQVLFFNPADTYRITHPSPVATPVSIC